jgi:hypothetical protein
MGSVREFVSYLDQFSAETQERINGLSWEIASNVADENTSSEGWSGGYGPKRRLQKILKRYLSGFNGNTSELISQYALNEGDAEVFEIAIQVAEQYLPEFNVVKPDEEQVFGESIDDSSLYNIVSDNPEAGFKIEGDDASEDVEKNDEAVGEVEDVFENLGKPGSRFIRQRKSPGRVNLQKEELTGESKVYPSVPENVKEELTRLDIRDQPGFVKAVQELMKEVRDLDKAISMVEHASRNLDPIEMYKAIKTLRVQYRRLDKNWGRKPPSRDLGGRSR